MVCSSGSIEEHTSQIDRDGLVDRMTLLPSATSTTTSCKLESQSKLQQKVRGESKVRILCIKIEKYKHGVIWYYQEEHTTPLVNRLVLTRA